MDRSGNFLIFLINPDFSSAEGPVIVKMGNKWEQLCQTDMENLENWFNSTRLNNWAQTCCALFSLTSCAEFKTENTKLLL